MVSGVPMKLTNLALLTAVLGVAACSSSSRPSESATGVPEVEVVRSALRREMNPTLSAAELETLARSQADFAVDIYQAVRKQPENVDKDIFLSPHSVSIALAMTYAGARGETATEMKKALHFDLPVEDVLHKTFLELDESGTEASAATAVITNRESGSIDTPVVMRVDRPFFTAIVDRQTKALVFLGRILEPKL